MQPLRGKVAIVTGSSRGIGAEIARTLATAGATVVINYADNKLAADKICAAIAAAGGQGFAIQADVSDPAAVK